MLAKEGAHACDRWWSHGTGLPKTVRVHIMTLYALDAAHGAIVCDVSLYFGLNSC